MGYVMNMGGKSPQQIINEEKENNLLEAGAYEVALTKIEKIEKQSRKVHGKMNLMLKLTFTVQSGAKQGRSITRRVGVDHDSDSFVHIGRAFVSKLAMALGVHDFVGDLDALMHKPVIANVIRKTKDENSQYGPENEIKSFAAAGAAPPPAPAGGWKPAEAAKAPETREPEMAGADAAPQSTIAAGSTPPWKR